MPHRLFPCARHAAIAVASTILMCVSPPACGQPLFGHLDSIEWMAADSSLVVRGRIEVLTTEMECEEWLWHAVTIRVAETLKGQHQPTIQFILQSNDAPSEWELIKQWQSRRPELLVFLHESKCLVARDSPRYARCEFAPRSGRRDGSILILDAGDGGPVFTLAQGALTQPEEIILATKAAVAVGQQQAKLCSHSLLLPHDLVKETPWAQTGGGVKLSVPIDARLESQALQWLKSKDDPLRVTGVEALIYFRSDANAATLKSLLNDAHSKEIERHEDGVVKRERVYPVREGASAVLEAWGFEVPDIVIREAIPEASLELDHID